MSEYLFHHTCQFDPKVLNQIYTDTFGYKRDGLFLEVGAEDGIHCSNTFGLAAIGWGGLYVEAVHKKALECGRNHKRHKGINVCHRCVGSSNGPTSMWFIPEWGTATLCKSAAEMISREPHEIPIVTETLDTILANQGWPAEYELLVIDVDFAEVAVLQGYTIAARKPTLAIIELHENGDPRYQAFSAEAQRFVPEYFAQAGYDRIYADKINTVFRRKDLGLVTNT